MVIDISHLRQERCRSCAASIVWALTDAEKAMPIDPKPAADGNVRLTQVGNAPHDTIKATVLGPLELTAEEGPLYKTHFATCPDGPSWRKR